MGKALVMGILVCLGFAVQAAIHSLLGVGELEDVGQLLLGGGDAAGILAADHIGELGRQEQLLLFHGDTVFDDGHGNIGVYIAQNVHVDLNLRVNLDDVLLAHLVAGGVLDDGNGAVQLVQLQEPIQLHALSGGDVVNDNTILNGINIHLTLPPEA